jgi:hypothetical protein
VRNKNKTWKFCYIYLMGRLCHLRAPSILNHPYQGFGSQASEDDVVPWVTGLDGSSMAASFTSTKISPLAPAFHCTRLSSAWFSSHLTSTCEVAAKERMLSIARHTEMMEVAIGRLTIVQVSKSCTSVDRVTAQAYLPANAAQYVYIIDIRSAWSVYGFIGGNSQKALKTSSGKDQ